MKSPFEAGHELGEKMVERGPRSVGALFLGIGIACLSGNLVLLYALDRYVPFLLALSAPALLVGPYVLLTGRMERTPDNPTWWKIGYGAAWSIGLAIGLYFAFWHLA